MQTVRHFTVIHDRCAWVHAHDHLAHLIGLEGLLFQQRFERV